MEKKEDEIFQENIIEEKEMNEVYTKIYKLIDLKVNHEDIEFHINKKLQEELEHLTKISKKKTKVLSILG
jgi:DNA uptake protein ComE-like DNA-binding protein